MFTLFIFATINNLFRFNRTVEQPQQRLSPPPPANETEIERRERIRRLHDPSRPIMDEYHPHFYRQTPGGGIAS